MPMIMRPAAWVAGLGLTAALATSHAAEMTDRFADRPRLEGESVVIRGNNRMATVEAGEPTPMRRAGGHSLWASWLAPAHGLLSLDTRGSHFDTVLAVYQLAPGPDPAFPRLQAVAAADDEAEENAVEGRTVLAVSAGAQYEIAVDGYAEATGDVELALRFTRTDAALPLVRRWPADGTVREGETLILTVDIRAVGRQQLRWYRDGVVLPDQEEPTLVLHQVTAEDAGFYELGLSTDEAMYFSPAIEVQINSEGQSQVLARDKLEEAEATGLRPGDAGPRRVGLGSMGSGVMRGYNGSQVFSTLRATRDPAEPRHCGLPGGPTYWFCYQPPQAGRLQLDTAGSTFDTLLAVYTYEPPLRGYAGLIPLGCNDNGGAAGTSRLQLDVVPDRTYFIVVDGVNGARGRARLRYRLKPANPPPSQPVLQVVPQAATLAPGNPLTLRVVAAGEEPMTYQWFRNGTPLLEATGPTLTRDAVGEADAGEYAVTVRNAFGEAASPEARVEVWSRPRVRADGEGGLVFTFPARIGYEYGLAGSGATAGEPWAVGGAWLADAGGLVRVRVPEARRHHGFFHLRKP